MNATFEAAELIEKPQAIVLHGRTIGTVEAAMRCEATGKTSYHACINLRKVENVTGMFNAGLLQGHGTSPEEALRDAFTQSAREAEGYLATASALHTAIFGGTVSQTTPNQEDAHPAAMDAIVHLAGLWEVDIECGCLAEVRFISLRAPTDKRFACNASVSLYLEYPRSLPASSLYVDALILFARGLTAAPVVEG